MGRRDNCTEITTVFVNCLLLEHDNLRFLLQESLLRKILLPFFSKTQFFAVFYSILQGIDAEFECWRGTSRVEWKDMLDPLFPLNCITRPCAPLGNKQGRLFKAVAVINANHWSENDMFTGYLTSLRFWFARKGNWLAENMVIITCVIGYAWHKHLTWVALLLIFYTAVQLRDNYLFTYLENFFMLD